MQDKVTMVVDGGQDNVTERELRTYVVVATFARSITVKATDMHHALDVAITRHDLVLSNDDSMNLLNWNAYEVD